MSKSAMPDSNNVLYTVKDVATLLMTNPSCGYRIIRLGLLPVLKLGQIKVRKESLLNFLQKYEGMDLTNPEDIHPVNFKHEGQVNVNE